MKIGKPGSLWLRLFSRPSLFAWVVITPVLFLLSFAQPLLAGAQPANTPTPAPAPSRGPYSPIGLTFDNCNQHDQNVIIIALPKDSQVPQAPSGNYIYVATFHHGAVKFTDSSGAGQTSASNPKLNDADLFMFMYAPKGSSCP